MNKLKYDLTIIDWPWIRMNKFKHLHQEIEEQILFQITDPTFEALVEINAFETAHPFFFLKRTVLESL